MATHVPPTVVEVAQFYANDPNINTMTADRIQYWIDDINDKGIVTVNDFGKLYFNAFMALLGHFLMMFETDNIPFTGGIITSETVAKASISYAVFNTDNPFVNWFNLTKYGRTYLFYLSQLASTHGGFVAFGGKFV